MKKCLWLTLITAATGASLGTQAAVPTREQLLSGAWVPERREFPVSPTLDPCQDFYQYACAEVLRDFKLRDDRSFHDFAFSDSSERLLTAKKNYLAWLAGAPAPTERAGILKNNFNACMNPAMAAQEERIWVQNELRLITRLNSPDALARLNSNRLDQPDVSLLGFGADFANQSNPLRNDVILVANFMKLPERSYYDRAEITQDLTALYTDLFQTLGLANAAARAAAVVDLEKRFAQTYPLPSEIRQRLSENNYVARTTILRSYPNLRLEGFLKKLPEPVQLRELMPESLGFFNKALERESLDTLKDLLIARSLPEYMDDAYPDYFAHEFAFSHKHLGGAKVRAPRNERCTKGLMAHFGRELDAELLPILFPNFPENKVTALAEKIRGSILSELRRNTWLSEQGKAGALRKMSSATLLLFKPASEDDWDFTPPAKYTPDHPYENDFIRKRLRIQKQLSELGRDRNRHRWDMGPLEVNAYYSPSDNSFVLPAGILQYPFFDPEGPEATNIAAIGSVIGHELGHGIDDQGSKFDEQGRLQPWMTAEDLAEFTRRGELFIPRFERRGHNGHLTMGENIGDHVGITAAYAAAFPRPAEASAALKQAFFVQYARAWCYEARPSLKEMLLKTDPHALGDARVDEQVINLDGFSEAFSCKAGDAMYLDPKDRIRIW